MERATNGGATRFARRSRRIRLSALVGALAAGVVVGTGCPPPDTTPPGPVTNLQADSGDSEVALTWTNPTDADFAGVKIQRRTDCCPSSPTDGTTVFQGFAVNYTDTGLTNGQGYCYAVFAYDGVPNYSWGATACATPQESQTLEILVGELRELSSTINGLPPLVIADDDKEELVALVEEAEDEYEDDDPCAAALVLAGDQGYLPIVQTLRMEAVLAKSQEGVDAFEELYARGRTLRYEMLLGRGCEGEERVGEEAKAEADEDESDNTEMVGEFDFGEPKLLLVEEMNEVFTKLNIPGADSTTGMPGYPSVPILRQLLAAPHGTQEPEVEVILGQAESFHCNLVPFQEQAADDIPDAYEFYMPQFVKNQEIYAEDENFPGEDYYLTKLGDYRDLNVWMLEIPSGQYNPAKDELVLYDGVDVKVDFGTDRAAGFITEQALHPFELEPEVYTGPVLNKESALAYVEPWPGILRLAGEEFLILTHPDFETQAIALRDWKRSKGIWTNVVVVMDGAGAPGPDSAAAIDTFLHARYLSMPIRFSYLLLLGDADYIPTFYPSANNPALVGTPTIGSDWQYAILGAVGVDDVPDFAVGRIPVDTAAQAQIVVDKIIDYEDTPPSSAAFYANASIAAQFQCCRYDVTQDGRAQRTFTEVSEFCRNAMMAQGKTVDRYYRQTNDSDYTILGRDTTPRRYFDGTLLPFDLGPLGAYDWSQSEATLRTNVINAWNTGRFLIIHRDHGWQDGWGHPDVQTSDLTNPVTGLSNGDKLPVVFSVNCASGFFDNETVTDLPLWWQPYISPTGVYFCEQLLRMNNAGAVGVLGDTRNSPSWPNSSLLQGFMDAMWPSTIGTFGTATAKRRLGDVLNHGKLYMMTQSWGWMAGAADADDELLLWHCFGDPTLEVWTYNPNWPVFVVVVELHTLWERIRVILEEDDADGAIVTAFQQDGEGGFHPIGRGKVNDKGYAEFDMLDELMPDYELQIAISAPGKANITVPIPMGEVKVMQ